MLQPKLTHNNVIINNWGPEDAPVVGALAAANVCNFLRAITTQFYVWKESDEADSASLRLNISKQRKT